MKAEMRTATIFGGAAIFGACASLFEAMPAPPTGAHLGTAALLVLGLGFLLASNNMLVQYGVARIPANRASIIMLFEIVVTALSAWLFAGEVPGPREWAGGACIVVAMLLRSTKASSMLTCSKSLTRALMICITWLESDS